MSKQIYDIRRIVDVTCPKCGNSQKGKERSIEECGKCGQTIAALGHKRPPKEPAKDMKVKETSIQRYLRLERNKLEKDGRAIMDHERNQKETGTASNACN